VSSFKVHVGSRLVWPMRTNDFITRLKFRGIPYGDHKNIVILKFTDKASGWMGNPQPGELFCFEGEFNLLQCDNKNGSPINGIALGGASSNQKSYDLIRGLSSSMTVVADNDPAGKKMAQGIANVAPIRVIYPNDGKDADEYLRNGHSLSDLLSLAEYLGPSWEGLRESIIKSTNKQPNESSKRAATKEIINALMKKGRIIHANNGHIYFQEKTS
jgi:Toprim-like